MEQTESSIWVGGKDGKWFDILKPEEHEYEIEIIAHSLANLCRYTGHVDRFYSVAEHSVLVSRMVPDKLALCGLLHDASEAFVGDVSSPLKKYLPEYKKIEENVQASVAKFYNLPYPFPKEIHEADKRMYWNERQGIAPMGDERDRVHNQEFRAARKEHARGMAPHMAKRMFLAEYKKITKEMNNNGTD